MKSHYLPAVSSLVSLLEKPLNKVEHNMEKYMHQSYKKVTTIRFALHQVCMSRSLQLFEDTLCGDGEDGREVALSSEQPESIEEIFSVEDGELLWTW